MSSTQPSPPARKASEPFNILLVDDEPANLLALEALLADLGQNLVRAGGGEEALSRLLADDFAVVLLDVQMPGLGGFETARLIRGRERSRHTPIIFLTAFEDARFPAAEAYRLGAVDYLLKPVPPAVLRAKVAFFIELAEKTRQVERQAAALAAGERLQQEMRDRQEAERRAKEANLLLAAIVESSDDAILAIDLDGVIMSWNQGAERLLGYAADEVIGQPISTLIPSEHAEDVATILGRIRRGERVVRFESRRRRKDGTIIDVSLTVSPIRNAAGQVVGVSKIARDITARKRAEAERKEADRHRDEFLAMLAHELRNPIAAISNAIRLFGMPHMEEELGWAKDVVLRQVNHLARLIDDLLDISRIQRGKIRLRTERVDAAAVLRGAIEDVRPLVEERRHDLSVTVEPGPLRLDADPVRLQQVLVNLLSNAAKYTPAGGKVWLTAGREGDQVILRVRDNGAGIPPEKLPAMFELFTQGERSIDRSEGGLGIGLTLVQRLVELHGGSVSAASEGPGKGSTFTVRLPAAEDPPAAAAAPQPAARPAAAKGSRVLVVDDNVDMAVGFAKLLRFLGHDVRTAFDGPSGLVAAREHRPQVVLLDIGLPGMDGYEVAAQLRREDCCKDALLIAVTGYGQEHDRRRSRQAGFDHHLVKPVDHDTLLTLIGQEKN